MTKPGTVAIQVLVVASLVLGALTDGCTSGVGAAIAHRAASRLATCDEGTPTRRWWATYRVIRASGRPTTLAITGEGGPRTTSGRWTVWWDSSDATEMTASVRPGSSTAVPAATAHLLTPDGQCSLFLSAADPAGAVAVIGDSVFARVLKQLDEGRLRADGVTRGWQFGTVSGFGWSASAPTWPLSVVRGSWAIGLARGFFATHPAALVVELGADDALRSLFTALGGHRSWGSRVRGAVADNVAQLLRASLSAVPCTVVVTAPTNPTTLFGAGEKYVTAARQINSILRMAVDRLDTPRARIADWAVDSAGHDGDAQGSTVWFEPDGVHPNLAGDRALLRLVHRTLAGCPRT